MPICKKHNFIFVHIPKTGGTSIEKLLHIYNYDSRKPDMDKLHGHIPVDKSNDINNPLSLGDIYGYYLQHLTLDQIKCIISKKECSHFTSFAFVRNPWDRLVSEYIWAYSHLEFDDFINRVCEVVRNRILLDTENVHFRPQYEFLNSEINYICRFEKFKQELIKLNKVLSLNVNTSLLPHEKKSIRKHYSKYYSKKSVELIEEIYARDIDIYGYEYHY